MWGGGAQPLAEDVDVRRSMTHMTDMRRSGWSTLTGRELREWRPDPVCP